MHRDGRLRGAAIVATIMSNLWLETRLREEGIALRRTAVGDKYVLEGMLAEDLVLGGEQSGHIIFREYARTGDGILTGLLLLDTLLAGRQRLEDLLDDVRPLPQVQINVRVRAKPDLGSHPAVGPALVAAQEALGERGRVVLRYSGTEPLARVMVEGTDGDEVRGHAERLARLIGEELGA
jgi:phosphoglucosamine mutase